MLALPASTCAFGAVITMKRKRGQKPLWVRESAANTIARLLELAEQDDDHSKRYVSLARSISKKYNVPIPADKKRFICKKCDSILRVGKTLEVRVSRGFLVYKCKPCGAVRRYKLEKGD